MFIYTFLCAAFINELLIHIFVFDSHELLIHNFVAYSHTFLIHILSLQAREFRLAVAKMGQNLTDAEVAEFMRGVDKDGDGVISYEGKTGSFNFRY